MRSRPAGIGRPAAADVAEGRSDALVSAGSTGATMTAALFALRRMQGVRRPALALQLPRPGRADRPLLLLDVGANTEARAVDLVQFAYLGSAFSTAVLGVEQAARRAAVGRRGAEQGLRRGGGGEREARDAGGIDFIGNRRGPRPDGPRSRRGRHRRLHRQRRAEDDRGHREGGGRRGSRRGPLGPAGRRGGMLLRPALGSLRRQMDPDTTGGAILLGLRGVAVVGHGSSGPDGIANAVRLAARAVEERAVERTAELLERSGMTRGSMR